MGNQPSTFAERTFTATEIRFLEIRGTGITGKWLFEIRALEQIGPNLKPVRFIVEFLPKAFRYSRLALVGPGAVLDASEITGLVEVPEEIKTAFEVFVRQECERRRVLMRRTRQGPGYLLSQLATLITNAEIRPSLEMEQEVLGIIQRHLEKPAFIYRVRDAVDQYHFGDGYVGRFFVRETPTSV